MSTTFFLQQINDSILLPRQEAPDTITESEVSDPGLNFFPQHPGESIRIQARSVFVAPVKQEVIQAPPPAKIIEQPVWNFNGNFFSENELARTLSGQHPMEERSDLTGSTSNPVRFEIQPRNLPTYDWFLGIFLFIAILFIWIRIFYGKFFGMLGNALLSFQIAAKLFREKSALLRRVSMVLDFIYLLVLSVFLFELAQHYGLLNPGIKRFNQFIMIFNIIIIYAMFRLVVMNFTGYLFLNRNLFSEYTHNNFVINKGIGLILFPVVITAHYFPPSLNPLVISLGIFIIGAALVFKSLRAYQIIKRKDVLLFYLILYLCTLEILPLLLGYKIIISLI
jgi:hypothetical protein